VYRYCYLRRIGHREKARASFSAPACYPVSKKSSKPNGAETFQEARSFLEGEKRSYLVKGVMYQACYVSALQRKA
jgi:hypothetical protein